MLRRVAALVSSSFRFLEARYWLRASYTDNHPRINEQKEQVGQDSIICGNGGLCVMKRIQKGVRGLCFRCLGIHKHPADDLFPRGEG